MTLFKTIEFNSGDIANSNLPKSISKTFFLGLLIYTKKSYTPVEHNSDENNGLNSPEVLKQIKPI